MLKMTTNDEYYNIEEMAEDMAYIHSFSEFDAYQSFTDETAIYPEEKALEYCALGLASEAGEFAGKVKKWIRDGVLDTEAAKAELGDILWYVARCAEELEFYLSDVAKDNVDKLKDRMERNKIQGNGDYR
jgi:NTP pyrophosphatase (non-canonical NTP hydrolase)